MFLWAFDPNGPLGATYATVSMIYEAVSGLSGCREERCVKALVIVAIVILVQIALEQYQTTLRYANESLSSYFPGIEFMLAAVGIEAAWIVDFAFNGGVVAATVSGACSCSQSFATFQHFQFVAGVTALFLLAFLWPATSGPASNLPSEGHDGIDSVVVTAVAAQYPLPSMIVSFGVLLTTAYLL